MFAESGPQRWRPDPAWSTPSLTRQAGARGKQLDGLRAPWHSGASWRTWSWWPGPGRPHMTVVCEGAPGHPAARELYYGLGFRELSRDRRSSSAQADRAAVAMQRVLVTGMSGAGKSALLDELAVRGFRTVDTDYGDYFHTVDGERLWREDVSALRAARPMSSRACCSSRARPATRCASTSVRPHRAAQRAARGTGRTTGHPGRQPLREGSGRARGDAPHQQTVEPLLRASATLEVITTVPVARVADIVLDHVLGR